MTEISFSSFHDYFEDFHPHSLYYGFNGCGKTTFAGKTGMKTVLLDCGDSGLVTLREVKENLKIVRIKTTDHYLEVMEKIMRMADKIDLLVVDTLTGLQAKAIREVKGRGDLNQRKWGQIGGKIIEAINETKNFPHDVIYLAQERRRNVGDDTGIVAVAPSLTPGIREALSGSVDWIGRIYMEDDKRKLSFIYSDTTEAKDRADLFPKPIVWPKEGAYVKIRQRIVEAIHG